jgi:hypothetical protein
MNQKVNPVVGVLIAIVVLAGVGYLSLKIFGTNKELAPSTVVATPNMNDPKFKPDPRLGGGR